MATPLKRRHDSYAYAYQPSPGVIRRFPKQRVKIKKQNPLKVLTSLIFLGAVAYYVMPYMFVNYLEPMFLNRIQNKNIKADVSNYIHPTRNYLTNSELFGQNLTVPTTGKKMTKIASIGENADLRIELEKLSAQYSNLKPAIYVWDYSTGRSVEINADRPIPAASIIKIPIMIELFRKIEENQGLKINNQVVLEGAHLTSGSGDLQYGGSGYKTSLNFLAKEMIISSDNSATNAVLDYIGGKEGMNRALRNWGLEKSYMGEWLPDLNGQNKMSAKDVATMLYNLDNPKFLNAQSKEYIKEYMGNVKNRSLVQSGLPDGAMLYHKTGDIGKMLGDAGIVYSENGKKFIVVAMVERAHNDYAARDFVQKATEIIYGNLK